MSLLIASPIQPESSAVDINYEYVFTVALYRRFAYADRPPIKSAILATIRHLLITRGCTP